MAVRISIPDPGEGEETFVWEHEEQAIIRGTVTYFTNHGEQVSRSFVIYFHGEEKMDGNINDMIHLVVKP